MSANIESEMEEGEIVDDLSDISSEEEFLLRQRLEVLENYNNVLERKKAKRSSNISGSTHKVHKPLSDLSEISANDLEDNFCSEKTFEQGKQNKLLYKQKKKSLNTRKSKPKIVKKKLRHNKKRLETKVIPESSEESEDEYKFKRRKLENAVNVNNDKVDKSTLSARLKNMLCNSISHQPVHTISINDQQTFLENNNKLNNPMFSPISSITADDSTLSSELKDIPSESVIKNLTNFTEFINLCNDGQMNNYDQNQKFPVKDFVNSTQSVLDNGENIVTSIIRSEKENVNINRGSDKDSDEDLEMLRQSVLKTKIGKSQENKEKLSLISNSKNYSDDEDSDTAELRLICLRSSLLKKAIEMKQKEKLQKRLSQSSTIPDDILVETKALVNNNNSKNNTDTESIDMEIVSEDDKLQEVENILIENNTHTEAIIQGQEILNHNQLSLKEEEYDEDEDLLRAKLLTSLSKNLPNLINPTIIDVIHKVETNEIKQPTNPNKTNKPTDVVTEEKKFIIQLGESESEGEHEATKNLTKMHMKLSEQMEFQQKLDMFLKSTRNEVENAKNPIVQKQVIPDKTPEKFVAKAVSNLPKSEQIEYKNLVKRMAELERIKQLRQSTMGMMNKIPAQDKNTLKPNTSTNNAQLISHVDENINISRKKIAEESTKMMKLKEEAKKLSQKYKIVATELRNISTAIALNKKQQRSVQNYLTKIRLQHQTLLKRSKLLKDSKTSRPSPQNNSVPAVTYENNFSAPITKLQKQNHNTFIESNEATKNTKTLRTVKFSVLNENKEENNAHPKLSIQINFTSSIEDVKKPKSPNKDEKVDSNFDHFIIKEKNKTVELVKNVETNHGLEKYKNIKKDAENCNDITNCNHRSRRYKSLDDYQSPLQALGDTNWQADPNAILCPFEVCGECKDTDCKYLHTTITQ